MSGAFNNFLAVSGDLSAIANMFLPAAPGPTSAAYVMGGTVAKSTVNRLPPKQVGTVTGAPTAGDAYLRLGPSGVVDLNVADPGGDWAVMVAVRAPTLDPGTAQTIRIISNLGSAGQRGVQLTATVNPSVPGRLITFTIANEAGGEDDCIATLSEIPNLTTQWLCIYAEAVSGVHGRVRDLTNGRTVTTPTAVVRGAAVRTFQIGKGPGNTFDGNLREFDMAGLTQFSTIPTEPEIQASYAQIKRRLARFGHAA
jgi:hypothetical protein